MPMVNESIGGCSTPIAQPAEPPNRSRTSGGVTGKPGDRLPMFIGFGESRSGGVRPLLRRFASQRFTATITYGVSFSRSGYILPAPARSTTSTKYIKFHLKSINDAGMFAL